jgi:hypothetical protein
VFHLPIRITSKRNGFRRCGIEHPDKPVTYPDKKFSPEQLKMLKEEPMLIVEEVEKNAKPGGKESDNDPNNKEPGGKE